MDTTKYTLRILDQKMNLVNEYNIGRRNGYSRINSVAYGILFALQNAVYAVLKAHPNQGRYYHTMEKVYTRLNRYAQQHYLL